MQQCSESILNLFVFFFISDASEKVEESPSCSEAKYQSSSDVKYQSTSDVEYHSPSDSRYPCTTDTKYQSVYVMSDQKDECIIATEVSPHKRDYLPGKYTE